MLSSSKFLDLFSPCFVPVLLGSLGTLYVEGLISVSFASDACSLLCYGDVDLHMVALCSAYARIARICPLHIWQPECLISTLYQLERMRKEANSGN